MNQKINMDTHMICLEVADYYPDANVIFWLDYFEKKIDGKIHIILYRTIKPEIQKKYTNENIIWISEFAKTYDALGKYIEALDKNDGVIIVGGERLANASADKAIALLEYDDRDSRLHLQEDENWEEFSKQVDGVFGAHQSDISGLVLICNVNDSIVRVISKKLEDSSNMSICRTEMSGYHHESADHATRILREIRNKSLQEALDIIDKNAEKMSADHRILCQAIAYHNNGNITRTIALLNSIYDTLQDEHRLFLAEMYILQNDRKKAQEIFEEVYNRDKRQKGLFELGLRAYTKGEERYAELLAEGIRYEPGNPMFVERYANFLVNQGRHKEAAAWFRKMNTPEHELIARVNDLLAEGQSDIEIVKSYLFEVVEDNPALKNVALFKVAVYAKERRHYFNAYRLLREADLCEINEVTQSILEMKMEILGDTEKAGKALGKLKPYKKDRDRDMLLQERRQVLFECVNYFSYIENGFGYWRRFMECQQMDTWNASWKLYVLHCMRELAETDFTVLLKESYIAKLEISKEGFDCDTALYLLRISNSEEMPDEEMGCTREEAVRGCRNLIEMRGTYIQRIWLRYYCSIGASLFSENPQEANNYSMSITEYGKSAPKEEKSLTAALFLMSWANAQCRLGNYIEGIVCGIAAIKKLMAIGEAVPVLEEGLNIIAKYLGVYDQEFDTGEKADITVFIHKLNGYNESLNPLLYKYAESTEEVMQRYEEKIKTDEKNITWLIDLNNLIVGKIEEKEYDDAVGYIKEYYHEAEKLLEQRKDIAPQLLYSWGDILTKSGHSVENVLLGLELYDMALVFVERRRQVYHQEERASLAEIHDKIVRAFLCFAGLLYSAVDIAKEVKTELKRRICEKLAICLPLSVIEEKKYYSEKTISEELERKRQELQHLKQEYAVMIKNNSVENVEVNDMAERIESLTGELVRSHPYYMPLPQFKGTDWEKLQSVLKPDEVVYQYVLTDICIVSILVTDQWIDVRCKSVTKESETPHDGMKKYGYIVENSGVGDSSLDRCSAVISQMVADHLCEYVFHYAVKKVYVIPDISKSMFPFTAVQYEGRYLIDQVEEIVNFIDSEQVIHLSSDVREDIRIVNKVFGKREDSSIKYIKKWLDAYVEEGVVNITDCSDDFDRIMEECRNGANTVVIYGHGAKDPASKNVEGAQTIQGVSSMISVRELLDSVHAKNLILISCVGGTPNSVNPEMSSGTWTGMFERFSGNIMTCRWSVPTKDTMEMIEQVFQNLLKGQMSFAKALLMAQRSMKAKGKTQLSWAGVECWIN